MIAVAVLAGLAAGEVVVTANSVFNIRHPTSGTFLGTSFVKYPDLAKFEVSGVEGRQGQYWRAHPLDSPDDRVRCKSFIRLQHADSKRFLTASGELSFMSRNRLVSTQPETGNRTFEGWWLACDGQFLSEGKAFSLQPQEDRSRQLRVSKFFPYAYSKYWPQCPIQKQLQACTVEESSPETRFQVDSGYFMAFSDEEEPEKPKSQGSEQL